MLPAGLIKSAFRPSDDATVLPFLVPSNAFFVASALALAKVIDASAASLKPPRYDLQLELRSLSENLSALGLEVRHAIYQHAVVPLKLPSGEITQVLAYEVDGYGSHLIADDANLPSLLSLPLFGFIDAKDPLYVATRKAVLSKSTNKWFFEGKVARGVGGMHIGMDYVWPMSIIVRAMTSDQDEQVLDCLDMLKKTAAGTGEPTFAAFS